MKTNLFISLIFLIALNSCKPVKHTSTKEIKEIVAIDKISSITNKMPYNPMAGMEKLRRDNLRRKTGDIVKLKKPIHFLVFGDSKGSFFLKDVLNRADKLNPQFCLTTADLVNSGAGEIGIKDYMKLDKDAGWFFRKYPTWPTLGNHEVSGSKDKNSEENYEIGQQNFADFFGLKDPLYSFTYGNAKFIALDWIKVSESPEKLAWLENELKNAQGKHIFIFKHRPYFTVGSKSYNDVEGKSTVVTKLFTKYKVAAVFSGHDHLYHRTYREGVHYIISSGAGAYIYRLKRESDAIAGDAYYGRVKDEATKFKFHSSKGKEVFFDEALYFVISVKVRGNKVTIEMIDTHGISWDKFTFRSNF